jgi:hypothetical protein
LRPTAQFDLNPRHWAYHRTLDLAIANAVRFGRPCRLRWRKSMIDARVLAPNGRFAMAAPPIDAPPESRHPITPGIGAKHCFALRKLPLTLRCFAYLPACRNIFIHKTIDFLPRALRRPRQRGE